MKSQYDSAVLKKELEPYAQKLSELLIKLPDRDEITDTLDYLLGAIYGIHRAMDAGFAERPGTWDSTYRPHLVNYVEDIQQGRPLNKYWLGGFYFNSAIQRLAACFDRIPKLLKATGNNARLRMAAVNTGKYEEWDAVYEELNFYKHDPEGRASGRKVGMIEAVSAFKQAVDLLDSSKARLI